MNDTDELRAAAQQALVALVHHRFEGGTPDQRWRFHPSRVVRGHHGLPLERPTSPTPATPGGFKERLRFPLSHAR